MNIITGNTFFSKTSKGKNGCKYCTGKQADFSINMPQTKSDFSHHSVDHIFLSFNLKEACFLQMTVVICLGYVLIKGSHTQVIPLPPSKNSNIYILLDVLLCSIAEYFYELCRILVSP